MYAAVNTSEVGDGVHAVLTSSVWGVMEYRLLIGEWKKCCWEYFCRFSCSFHPHFRITVLFIFVMKEHKEKNTLKKTFSAV